MFGDQFADRVLAAYAAGRNVYRNKEQIAWAPYGGGNAAQYFNSTFGPAADNENLLVCDKDAVNAQLGSLTVTLTDKDGIERQESMLGIFSTRTVDKGKQPKLDYGPTYTIERHPAARRAVKPVERQIKTKNAYTAMADA